MDKKVKERPRLVYGRRYVEVGDIIYKIELTKEFLILKEKYSHNKRTIPLDQLITYILSVPLIRVN